MIDSLVVAVDGVPPSEVPAAPAVERAAVRLFDGSETGTTLGPSVGAASESEGEAAVPDSPTTANVAVVVAGAAVVTAVLVDAVVADAAGAETTVCEAGATTVSVSATVATLLTEVSAAEDSIAVGADGEPIDLFDAVEVVEVVVLGAAVVSWPLEGGVGSDAGAAPAEVSAGVVGGVLASVLELVGGCVAGGGVAAVGSAGGVG